MKEFERIIENTDIKVVYKLGQNANENHELIDYADRNDWWFHLEDYPSGHCIVERSDIEKEDIIFASTLVKENSKYKNFKNVSICYTQIKNIKKTRIPGEVKILKKPNTIIL